MSLDELVEKIEQWADARNLIEGATPAAQFEKLGEEFGELGRALIEQNNPKIFDAIGDMFVVLTILSAQYGEGIEMCVEGAYEEIKDRKGRMVNGIFVKSE